jgi:hypothetical protein
METITFANESYIAVLANWLACMRKIKRKNVVVYTLDETTKRFVENSGYEARAIKAEQGFGNFWRMRARCFLDLVESNTTFVHSDADAIWLRNMPKKIFGTKHICFSQGTTHPPVVFKDVGHVVCCGLFMAKPSDGSKRFFRKLHENVEVTQDDQRSVNNILRQQGMRWTHPNDEYSLDLPRGNSITCWQSALTGYSENLELSVQVLPHWAAQRAIDTHKKATASYVKHYLSPKDPIKKLNMFAKHGLLFIKADWQKVEKPEALGDYMDR